jgi:RND family efflux transporter MFP subunit
LAAAVLVAACSPEEEKEPEGPQVVEAVAVKQAPAARSLHYSATLRGAVEVRVFSQVPDRIRVLNVEEGDRVRRGQLIAVIAHNALSSGLEAALAGVKSAQAQLEQLRNEQARVRKLHRAQAVGEAQLDRIEKQVQATEANVRRLEAMVNQATTQQERAFVRAPIDGIIGERYLERGDMAAPQLPIVTIVQLDELKAEVQVPEFELPLIEGAMEKGYPVRIRTAGLVDELGRRMPQPARIVRISPTIDLATRMATVEIRCDNEQRRLRPGMLVDVEVVVEKRDQALLVPAYAVLRKGEVGASGEAIQHVVFTAADGRARQRTVTLGIVLPGATRAEDGWIEVRSGLEPGDRVIVRGQHLLEDGDPIAVDNGESQVAPGDEERPQPAAESES